MLKGLRLLNLAWGFTFVCWSGLTLANPCQNSTQCNDYLIRFSHRASAQKIESILRRESLTPVEYFENSQIYHALGKAGPIKTTILRNLNADPDVAYAEPNHLIHVSAIPNDPHYPSLWNLHNIGQTGGTLGADIGMENVWNSITGAGEVIVAVIDTGIDYTHEDLATNMWVNSDEIADNGIDDDGNGYVDDVYGYNFYDYTPNPMDDHFHGTHVAGIIGAIGNNGVGITGVNWNVKLMAVKFLSAEGWGYLSDAILAIEYALNNGAKVLNNSWGFQLEGGGLPSDPALEPVQSLRSIIEASDMMGAIFVAAAGNNGIDSDISPNYPSSYSVNNILSVAATDASDTLAFFSNYGPISVDLGAPGVSILSSLPMSLASPPYALLSGTSMATPHVSGAAALLWAYNPLLSHRQVIERLLQGAEANSTLRGKTVTGGRLDVWQSLALDAPDLNHPPTGNAGPEQFKDTGELITLQGSAIDEDGDTALNYQWSLTSPPDSRAELSSNSGQKIYFTADIPGIYYSTLMVSDWQKAGVPVTTVIHVEDGASKRPTVVIRLEKGEGTASTNSTPVTEVNVGERVTLNGSESSAKDNPTLDYRWGFIERPSESTSTLDTPEQALAHFTPDQPGRYTLQLSVSTGKYASLGEMTFQAISQEEAHLGGAGGCSLTLRN